MTTESDELLAQLDDAGVVAPYYPDAAPLFRGAAARIRALEAQIEAERKVQQEPVGYVVYAVGVRPRFIPVINGSVDPEEIQPDMHPVYTAPVLAQQEPVAWINEHDLIKLTGVSGVFATVRGVKDITHSFQLYAVPVLAPWMVSVNRAELLRLLNAMDAIYNHNEAARAAVIQHYGTLHDPQLLAAAKGESHG